jgi:hypothetical protein
MSDASEWNVVRAHRELASASSVRPCGVSHAGSALAAVRTHRTYSSVLQGRIYSLVSLQVAAGEIRTWKGVFRSKPAHGTGRASDRVL